MNFADGMKKVIKNLDAILAVSDSLSPKALEGLEKLNAINWDNAALMTGAHDQMLRNMQTVEVVANGMHAINKVVLAQNQIQYVSDIRDSIGLVAGSIENVNKIGEDLTYLRAAVAMQPMMEEVLALSVKMDLVLDIEEKIEYALAVDRNLEDKMNTIRSMSVDASNSATSAANMLNEIKIREKNIDEKLRKMEGLEARMADLSVVVDFVSSDTPSSHSYNKLQSTLTLRIPKGEKGDKGDSIQGERGFKGDLGLPGSATNQGKTGAKGKDGKDFSASFYGLKRELGRYRNAVKGTSLVALDESPTMIYFKISDALDDWTDGQPFGISHGELSVNEIAGAVMLLINEKRNHHA